MTTITVGRATITAPNSMQRSGDTLAVSGVSVYSTVAEAAAVKQQLNGHRGDVVPVLADSWDANLTGFYTFVSVATADILGVDAGFTYSLTLAQLAGGFAAAHVEEVATRGDQQGAPASVDGYGMFSFPASALWSSESTISSAPYMEDGDELLHKVVRLLSAGSTSSYRIAPDKFYYGSCRLEMYDGTNWNILVGKQLPTGATLDNLRISNGIIRVTFTSNDFVSDATMTLERWVYDAGGSAWGDPHVWNMSASFYLQDEAPTVIRNDQSRVSLRLVTGLPNAVADRSDFVVTLDRGHVTVRLVDNNRSVAFDNIGATNATFSGTYPNAEKDDSTDADGYKYIIIGPTIIDGQVDTGYSAGVATPASIGIIEAPLPTSADTSAAQEAYIGATNTLRMVT